MEPMSSYEVIHAWLSLAGFSYCTSNT